MKIFLWLDDWLFNYIFQPILNKWQWSAVEATKFCIMGMVVVEITNAYFLFTKHKLYDEIPRVALMLVISILWYATVQIMPDKTKQGMRNSRRISNFDRSWRLFNLIILIYGLFSILIQSTYFTLFDNFLIFSASYFIACDKPPPPTPKTAPIYGNFAHSEG